MIDRHLNEVKNDFVKQIRLPMNFTDFGEDNER